MVCMFYDDYGSGYNKMSFYGRFSSTNQAIIQRFSITAALKRVILVQQFFIYICIKCKIKGHATLVLDMVQQDTRE